MLFVGCHSEEDLKMASLVDEINAYSYLYPVEFLSKKLKFKWYGFLDQGDVSL